MKKKDNKGFSLIELIIAIAILVILTGLLAPQFMRYMERAREAKDMQALDTLYSATQAAITNEDVYGEIKNDKTGIFGNLSGGVGLTLKQIKDVDDGTTAGATNNEKLFCKELLTTIGNNIEWSSKAVTSVGTGSPKNPDTAVYVLVDENLKVHAWIGKAVTANNVPTKDDALNPTTTNGGAQTQATTFLISK